MNNLFNIGEEVHVFRWLTDEEKTDFRIWVSEMEKSVGKKFFITAINPAMSYRKNNYMLSNGLMFPEYILSCKNKKVKKPKWKDVDWTL